MIDEIVDPAVEETPVEETVPVEETPAEEAVEPTEEAVEQSPSFLLPFLMNRPIEKGDQEIKINL